MKRKPTKAREQSGSLVVAFRQADLPALRRFLASALLALPPTVTSETIRFLNSKFGEGGSLHIITDGDREIWRQWTPASKLKQRKAQHKHAAKA